MQWFCGWTMLPSSNTKIGIRDQKASESVVLGHW